MRFAFKRRRPTHRATGYGYKFSKPAPELCMPCVDLYGIEAVRDAIKPSPEDRAVASWHGYTPAEWAALPNHVRTTKRSSYFQARGL